MDNPKFLAIQFKSSCYDAIPNYILPIIEEGVLDGTIITDKPHELAEIITMLINIWLNPSILGTDKERLPAKCHMLNEIVKQYKLTLFDDETIENLKSL